MTTLTGSSVNEYWGYTLWLALFTILYNLLEAMISIFLDISDEALTLFGVDLFIEVMSGIGILAMVLRITGISFYLLIIGPAGTVTYNLINKHKPVGGNIRF